MKVCWARLLAIALLSILHPAFEEHDWHADGEQFGVRVSEDDEKVTSSPIISWVCANIK